MKHLLRKNNMIESTKQAGIPHQDLKTYLYSGAKISKQTQNLSAGFVFCSTIGTVAEPALLTTTSVDFMPFEVKFCIKYLGLRRLFLL